MIGQRRLVFDLGVEKVWLVSGPAARAGGTKYCLEYTTAHPGTGVQINRDRLSKDELERLLMRIVLSVAGEPFGFPAIDVDVSTETQLLSL